MEMGLEIPIRPLQFTEREKSFLHWNKISSVVSAVQKCNFKKHSNSPLKMCFKIKLGQGPDKVKPKVCFKSLLEF